MCQVLETMQAGGQRHRGLLRQVREGCPGESLRLATLETEPDRTSPRATMSSLQHETWKGRFPMDDTEAGTTQPSLFDPDAVWDGQDTELAGNPLASARPEDFGEKIGGARKDLYHKALDPSDLEGVPDGELVALATKDHVWPRPDYREMVAGGATKVLAWYVKRVRDALPTRVAEEHMRSSLDETGSAKRACEEYVALVSKVRDAAMACETLDDVRGMGGTLRRLGFVRPGATYGWVAAEGAQWYPVNRIARALGEFNDLGSDGWFMNRLAREAARHDSLLTPREEGKQRPAARRQRSRLQLGLVTMRPRVGPDSGRRGHVSGSELMERFGLRGGEFGNWLTNSECIDSLDMCWDAFSDLAVALDIADEDIALGGALGIAFGARGQGGNGALAHYEPGRMVINITRERGAGSLAHEWFHFLDDAVGRAAGQGPLMASARRASGMPVGWRELHDTMLARKDGAPSDYYLSALDLDTSFAKASHGYWSSTTEMLARAGSAFVHDRCEAIGIVDDYLTRPGPDTVMTPAGKVLHLEPAGEERLATNEAIRALVDDARELGLVHGTCQRDIVGFIQVRD